MHVIDILAAFYIPEKIVLANTVYSENFVAVLFSSFSPSDLRVNLKLGQANFISKIMKENVGKFKTGRISLRSPLGKNKTGWIQNCIQYRENKTLANKRRFTMFFI